MDRLQGNSSNEYKQHVGRLLSEVLPTVVSGKVNEAKQGFTQSEEGNPITKGTSNYTIVHSELIQDQMNSKMSKNSIPNLQVNSHVLAVPVNGVNVPMTKERLESLALLFEQSLASINKLPEPLKKELLAVQSEIEGMMLKQHTQNMYVEMKTILSRLGLGEEAELMKDEYKPTLKAAILSLLQEEIPASLRDVSEKIMAKLNVQTLVSQPPGDFHHLQFSVPLNFLGLNTDLQLEWTGKKKEDGTLNPDFCRVLFYLDLEMLKEMMIDMQVQNRIISIKIFNDSKELKAIGTNYVTSLKSKVEEKGYTLSSLQFHPMTEQVITKRLQPSILSEKGVDITI
ncbi:hypothetical protein Q73_05535 [Bacillus coahuilensis m2-6]|uniref:hypothetical protein n=1 Tax=Bacillus coahuilensis TaxID=408580 RepID=UPI0007502AEF|nr:hypothetical protein [Bacillus coahuilensis]KUP08650.1 hypothetical protein Q73_05535 [Bacillus coahuilensis m2-6]